MSVRTEPSDSPHAEPHPVYTGDEIDLRQLARALWRYRWVVVLLGIFGGLGGLGVSLLSTRHVAEGLFLTPAMTMASFKQYEAALGNEARMDRFIELQGLEGTQSAELLRTLTRVPGAMDKAVRPAFTLTGREAKAYDIQIEESGVLGFHLELSREQRTEESPIRRLADYVRHTMIDVDLRNVMLDQCIAFRGREQLLRNEQIQSDFKVSQAQQRAERLRQLIARIPGAGQIDNRQVVSLEGGGERFLSPTTQLVAVEVAISEAAIEDTRRERERTAAALKKQYYCGALELQREAMVGQDFLKRLEGLQEATFADQDLKLDVVEQTANEIALQRQSWLDNYLERSRFVVSPDGGEQKRRKPGVAVGGLLGGVLGGFFGLLLAFALAWWHDNREEVLAAAED